MSSVLLRATLVSTLAAAAACAGSMSSGSPSPAKDPRVGLSAGLMNAGEAVSNLKITAKAVSPDSFLQNINSDITFTGKYAIQGNFRGHVIWDISNHASPVMITA